VNPELRKHMHALFDAHDEAIRALQSAGNDMDRAIQAMGAANRAYGQAITAALNANRAAIDLLEHISGQQ
jgi:hypothetical protein